MSWTFSPELLQAWIPKLPATTVKVYKRPATGLLATAVLEPCANQGQIRGGDGSDCVAGAGKGGKERL